MYTSTSHAPANANSTIASKVYFPSVTSNRHQPLVDIDIFNVLVMCENASDKNSKYDQQMFHSKIEN